MTFIFLLPSVSQPRSLKRVKMFLDSGHKVQVHGFKRGYYRENYKNTSFDINLEGAVEDGKYFRRMCSYVKLLLKLKKTYRNEEVIFYGFGFDFGFLLLLFSVKYIYEISDLIYLKYNGIVRNLFKKIDLVIIKKSFKSVFTSEGFVDYLGLENSTGIRVIPNKVDPELRNVNREIYKFHEGNKIRFGYAGRVRYPETFIPFLKVLSKYPEKFEFHIYGDGPLKKEIESFIHSNSVNNIYYYGTFSNPADLEEIYATFDISYVCYKGTDNERYLEPNKLYESLLFCKPMLVQKNTFLAKRINQLQIGFVIDGTNEKEIENFLLTLNNSRIETLSKRCFTYSKDRLFNNSEELLSLTTNK